MSSPPLTASKDFKLGLFSSNCSSGLAVTKAPERWSGSWADNVRLARLADDVGINFMLPIARWIGYGGETNIHEGVLDPTAWAAGLLAQTRRLCAFSTVHTAFNHPVVAAMQPATVDQIGGRAGVDIVAGWNKAEYETMGVELPHDHDDRYAMAQERRKSFTRFGPFQGLPTTTAGSGNSNTWKITRPGRGRTAGILHRLRRSRVATAETPGRIPVRHAQTRAREALSAGGARIRRTPVRHTNRAPVTLSADPATT